MAVKERIKEQDMKKYGVDSFAHAIRNKGDVVIKTGKKLIRDSSPKVGITPERKKIVKSMR